MKYIIGYLGAIVSANWLVSQYGPGISIWTALAFIGLVITTRDHLHDSWLGKNLKVKMFFLVLTGSVLSLLFNAGRIALASFIAFLLSETVDALIYHRLLKEPKWLRVNGSNLLSALVDSVVFPVLAFGFPLLIWVMAGQFLAKTIGGAGWFFVLEKIGD